MNIDIENYNEVGVKNNIEIEKKLSNNQNNFLGDLLGKVVNSAIDAGIKYLLPDKISNDIIKLKNKIFTKRFKTELKNTLNKVIKKGKRDIGRTEISLRNIKEVHKALYKGNILENISELISKYLKEKSESGKIDKSVSEKILNSKGILMQNISTNIENELINQMREINILKKYNLDWKKAFESKNLEDMKKLYREIEKKSEVVMPIKNILKEVEEIKKIQNILEKNNWNFKQSEKEFLESRQRA